MNERDNNVNNSPLNVSNAFNKQQTHPAAPIWFLSKLDDLRIPLHGFLASGESVQLVDVDMVLFALNVGFVFLICYWKINRSSLTHSSSSFGHTNNHSAVRSSRISSKIIESKQISSQRLRWHFIYSAHFLIFALFREEIGQIDDEHENLIILSFHTNSLFACSLEMALYMTESWCIPHLQSLTCRVLSSANTIHCV